MTRTAESTTPPLVTWRRLAIGLVVMFSCLWLTESSAHAERKVYLNGVDLSDVDVRGHKFDGCEVRFDKQGNVYITVKGLKIQKTPTKGSASKPASKDLGRKHFLVVKPLKGNVSPYQVSVYINGKLAHLVKGKREMQVHDVTRYIKSGKNSVRMVAVRELGKRGSASRSPTDTLEIVLGRGTIKKGTVVIQVPHVSYRRRASETKRFDNTFRFTVK